MAKKRKGHDDAWAHAKRVCRLNARQVEMAKRLGMNPKKLPSLVPSPSQRWKAPVGVFIEQCYAKSFGDDPAEEDDRHDLDRPGAGSADARDVCWAIGEARMIIGEIAMLAELEEITPEDRLGLASDLRLLADRIESGPGESWEREAPVVRDNAGARAGLLDHRDVPF